MDGISSSDIRVKLVRSADRADLIRLYKDAGWWASAYDDHPEFIDAVVTDSALFAGAYCGPRMVGMGRALSDMSSDAYIQDVVVLKQFRGGGIGKRIIQCLIDRLVEHGVDWIGVVAQPGTSPFYERLGFERLKAHIPMKYKV